VSFVCYWGCPRQDGIGKISTEMKSVPVFPLIPLSVNLLFSFTDYGHSDPPPYCLS